MTRHRKFLKAEKARTKLKATKLPKGLNVTKTEFKTRKIVIPEQLRARGENEVLSKSRLNLRDCLVRLGHNNLAHRLEGVKGLRDIVAENFEVVNTGQHMANVLGAVAALSIDIERDVRRESFRVLSLLIAKAGQHQIEPFFDLLCSYLRCAMTHIQPSIHEDSLLLLDVLTTYLPGLVAANHEKILGNFIDMISKLRSDGAPTRTLKVRLAGKLTSSKWRTRVLEKLFSLFMAVIRAKRGAQSANIQELRMVAELTVEEMFSLEKVEERFVEVNYFNEDRPYPYCLLHDVDQRHPDFSHLIGLNLLKTGSVDGIKVQQTIEALTPLLFESWVEIRPNNSEAMDEAGMVLTTEAAFILKQVLQIFTQFLTLIELTDDPELLTWFNRSYVDNFAEYILSGFPYVQVGATRKTGEKEFEKSGGSRCTFQNLAICKLIFVMTSDGVDRQLDYILNGVQHWYEVRENTNLMLNILSFILLNGHFQTTQKTKEILKALVRVYLHEKTRIEVKSKVLVLLCRIFMEQQSRYGHDAFVGWMKTLPSLLTGPTISLQVVQVLVQLSRQSNKTFVGSLTECIVEILENSPKICVTGAPNEVEGRKVVAGLVFWIKDKEKLQECMAVAQTLPDEMKSFVLDAIGERMEMMK